MPVSMPSSPFLAQILDSSAPGYAVLATERLLARRPDIADRFAPHPRLAWKENLTGRIRDLSDAIEQNRPGVFIDQVVWGKIAFTSRAVPVEDLRESLVALREILTEELPEGERDTPARLIADALDALAVAPANHPTVISIDTPEGRLAAAYVLALLEGDRRRASSLILSAVDDARLNVRDAYLDVLIPAQRELGRMWHLNEITVAEEHFVTSTTKMIMAQLLARAESAPPNGRTAVCACAQGESHDIGLHVASDLLEITGWRVIFLGANMPPGDLIQAVVDFRADLLALSATLVSQRRAVAQTIRLLRDTPARANIPVLVGGHAFDADDTAWQDVGADARAILAQDAPDIARRLLKTSR